MAEATGFSFLELLQDKNFQNLLAGVGGSLDPEGIGGALGRGTLAYNKALAAQAAAKTTLANRTATTPVAPATTTPTTTLPTTSSLVSDAPAAPVTSSPSASRLSYSVQDPVALADEVSDLLTPPGQEGATSVARDKSGAINVKYNPPAKPAPTTTTALSPNSQYSSVQDEIQDTLDPYLPRRSVQQPEITLAVAEPAATGVAPTKITPQMRANDRTIVLKPESSEDDYAAAIGQGARRRNLDEAKAQELIDTGPVRKAARSQRGIDIARFDADPNYRVNSTLDYLDTLANRNLALRPKTAVVTTTPQLTPGVEVSPIPNEVEALVAPKPNPSGTTEVISPGGIPEVPRGTPMSIPNAIYTPPATNVQPTAPSVTQPAPVPPRRGVAEAATPPANTRAAQISDLLNLPMPAARESSLPPGATVDPDGTVHLRGEVSKFSPDAPTPAEPPKVTQFAPRSVREQYDLRGLSPDEVDKVVGRALEADRNEVALGNSLRASNQLVETDEGYYLVNRATNRITPLTREGKIDAKKELEFRKYDRLSNFSKELSAVPGTDTVVRPKMSESQAKAFEYGSRALQANERQRRLESKYTTNEEVANYASRRANVLQTLESLPPDMPMNIVGTILGATGAIGQLLLELPQAARDGWNALTTGKAEWKDLGIPVRAALEAAGLGPAAARVYASLGTRKDLSDDEREFLQNSLEFSTAMLRRDSGAAVSAGEFLSTHRQYFPTVGDKQTDVLRKMRTRQTALRGLRTSAGRPLLPPDVED